MNRTILDGRRLDLRCLAAFLGACLASAAVRSAEIAPAARQAAAIIDSMQVESHWPAGVHVNWETGVPDGKAEHGSGKHTHCSAFAAAAAKRLGVYLLRPPEHPQLLLANAQVEWLAGEGAKQGWHPVRDAVEAQHSANQGLLVVAAYRNHHDDMPGHIAIVRPSEKNDAELESEGPQITQAGGTNYCSTTLAQGFAGHPAAWKNRREVLFYAHPIDAAVLASH
jgi:hypothetical protein